MTILRIPGQVEVSSWWGLCEDDRVLMGKAIHVREHASAPVSGFMVGAALRPVGVDKVFLGCNVEDNTHTSTIHAEAAALAAMITTLGPKARCSTAAIALGHSTSVISCPPEATKPFITELGQIKYTPCPHCRGLLNQYGGGYIRFLCLQANGQIVIATLAALLPCGFDL